MPLSPEEARVLACLVEKETTVPDAYPLTLNALRLACNQSSNRDPVVAYDDRLVEGALLSLKSQGLARFVHASHGARSTRYRHAADERWRLSRPELAVLSVLVLRGPQTVGELKTRTERQHAFTDVAAIEAVLDELAARTPDPFVARLDRRPGERDARWSQLLTPEDAMGRSGVAERVAPAGGGGAVHPRAGELEERIAAVERRLARIESELGLAPDPTAPDPDPADPSFSTQ